MAQGLSQGKVSEMDQHVIGTNDHGKPVVSDKAPRMNVRIGGYVDEDGELLVTVGDVIIGRLPDLADVLSELDQRYKGASVIRQCQAGGSRLELLASGIARIVTHKIEIDQRY